MSSSASLTSGVAGRYATALFEIAKESDALTKVEDDVIALKGALAESSDLRALIASPVYTREQLAGAVRAVAERMNLGFAVSSTIGLMAQNRRLFVLPAMLSQVLGLIADDRGELTAEVRAARPLTDAQSKALSDSLKSGVGKDVKVNVTVDESLIGGLVVKVGSRMIDTSIRAKLANLQNVMKEVG